MPIISSAAQRANSSSAVAASKSGSEKQCACLLARWLPWMIIITALDVHVAGLIQSR